MLFRFESVIVLFNRDLSLVKELINLINTVRRGGFFRGIEYCINYKRGYFKHKPSQFQQAFSNLQYGTHQESSLC